MPLNGFHILEHNRIIPLFFFLSALALFPFEMQIGCERKYMREMIFLIHHSMFTNSRTIQEQFNKLFMPLDEYAKGSV